MHKKTIFKNKCFFASFNKNFAVFKGREISYIYDSYYPT
jgi:hypothetical protein